MLNLQAYIAFWISFDFKLSPDIIKIIMTAIHEAVILGATYLAPRGGYINAIKTAITTLIINLWVVWNLQHLSLNVGAFSGSLG